jgi:hypothetical protein
MNNAKSVRSIAIMAAGLVLIALPLRANSAVEFQFAWKAGMKCQVANSVSTSSNHDVSTRFVLQTTAVAGGLLIEASEVRAGEGTPPFVDAPTSDDMAALLLPSFVVDTSGAFVRLQDVEKSRKAARRMFELQRPGADAQKLKQAVEMMASRTLLEQTVQTLWNPGIASWKGTSWQPQEIYNSTIDQIFPIGNLPYKAKVEAQFVGMRPCTQTAKTTDCALLTTRQRPDPVALRDLTLKMVEAVGGPAKDMATFKIDLRIDTETLTRPKSLIPSRVTIEKHVSVRGTENGQPFDSNTLERREWIFNCD